MRRPAQLLLKPPLALAFAGLALLPMNGSAGAASYQCMLGDGTTLVVADPDECHRADCESVARAARQDPKLRQLAAGCPSHAENVALEEAFRRMEAECHGGGDVALLSLRAGQVLAEWLHGCVEVQVVDSERAFHQQRLQREAELDAELDARIAEAEARRSRTPEEICADGVSVQDLVAEMEGPASSCPAFARASPPERTARTLLEACKRYPAGVQRDAELEWLMAAWATPCVREAGPRNAGGNAR